MICFTLLRTRSNGSTSPLVTAPEKRRQLGGQDALHETNSKQKPLKVGLLPQKEMNHLPTINFQGKWIIFQPSIFRGSSLVFTFMCCFGFLKMAGWKMKCFFLGCPGLFSGKTSKQMMFVQHWYINSKGTSWYFSSWNHCFKHISYISKKQTHASNLIAQPSHCCGSWTLEYSGSFTIQLAPHSNCDINFKHFSGSTMTFVGEKGDGNAQVFHVFEGLFYN